MTLLEKNKLLKNYLHLCQWAEVVPELMKTSHYLSVHKYQPYKKNANQD